MPKTQGRSFESPGSERDFYAMLERYEATFSPNRGSDAFRTVGRLLKRRWLALRLRASARLNAR